jgi:hypothetical protein
MTNGVSSLDDLMNVFAPINKGFLICGLLTR